jgi:hypothetical protein
MTTDLKQCSTCKLLLPREQNFYMRDRYAGLYCSSCKKCDNRRRAKYVVKQPPKGIKTIQGVLLTAIIRDLGAGFNLKQTAERNKINYYALLSFNKRTPLRTVNLHLIAGNE